MTISKDDGQHPATPLAEFSVQVADQVTKASRELDRLHELLADAITALFTHFEELGALTDAERQLTRAALARPLTEAELVPLRDRLREIETKIIEHLNGALTALQFQDMSSQLINHIRDRIGALRSSLETSGKLPVVTREAPVQATFPADARGGRRGGAVELF